MTSPRMDLGGGNAIEITGKQNKPGDWGLIWYHQRPTGEPCEGCLSWDPADARHWSLIQRDPLTLAPSLQCNLCEAHGFIEDGHWRRA